MRNIRKCTEFGMAAAVLCILVILHYYDFVQHYGISKPSLQPLQTAIAIQC